MPKKLTKREIIIEEITFKVRQAMEKKVSDMGDYFREGSWCDVCHHWRKKRNSEMEYCLEHQKEFDKLLKEELEEALKDIKG